MKERLVEVVRDSLKKHIGKSCLLAENITDDILADGWFRPPCKVGQTVYKFNRYNKTIIDECRIRSILQREDGSLKISVIDLRYMNYFEILPDAIGKTIFLTREKAEAKLKEGGEDE